MLKEELRENVFSRWFLAAFLVMLLTLLSMSLPERIVSRGDEEQYRMSALQLAILPIYFGGVMLLFPFCACTAAAPQQTIEIRTGFAKWKIMRGGLNAYLRRKAIAGFVSGGLSVMLAFVAHAVIWALIAMPSQPELYGTHEIPYRPDTIYYPLVGIAHGWPVLLWKAGGHLRDGRGVGHGGDGGGLVAGRPAAGRIAAYLSVLPVEFTGQRPAGLSAAVGLAPV